MFCAPVARIQASLIRHKRNIKTKFREQFLNKHKIHALTKRDLTIVWTGPLLNERDAAWSKPTVENTPQLHFIGRQKNRFRAYTNSYTKRTFPGWGTVHKIKHPEPPVRATRKMLLTCRGPHREVEGASFKRSLAVEGRLCLLPTTPLETSLVCTEELLSLFASRSVSDKEFPDRGLLPWCALEGLSEASPGILQTRHPEHATHTSHQKIEREKFRASWMRAAVKEARSTRR